MAENSTLARPYAKAVFELAKAGRPASSSTAGASLWRQMAALSADAGVKALYR